MDITKHTVTLSVPDYKELSTAKTFFDEHAGIAELKIDDDFRKKLLDLIKNYFDDKDLKYRRVLNQEEANFYYKAKLFIQYERL